MPVGTKGVAVEVGPGVGVIVKVEVGAGVGVIVGVANAWFKVIS